MAKREGKKATTKAQTNTSAEAHGVWKDADAATQGGEYDAEVGSQEPINQKVPGQSQARLPSSLDEVASLTKAPHELTEKSDTLEDDSKRLLEGLRRRERHCGNMPSPLSARVARSTRSLR